MLLYLRTQNKISLSLNSKLKLNTEFLSMYVIIDFIIINYEIIFGIIKYKYLFKKTLKNFLFLNFFNISDGFKMLLRLKLEHT